MKERIASKREAGMEKIPGVEWEFNHGEADARFGNKPPGPDWQVFGFPRLNAERPFVTSNFVADKNGLVVGANIKVENIVGRESFPDGQPRRPDIGSSVDYRMMRNLRAYADAVMWGRNTLTRQPDIIPDLMDDAELRAFRKKNSLPLFPKLVLVSNAGGTIDFGLRAFHTPGLEAVILTGQQSRDNFQRDAERARAEVRVIGLGDKALDMAQAMRYLRNQEGVEVLLVEGGHSLIESLHRDHFLHEAFVTTSDQALNPALVKDAKYMFDFEAEGARHIAHGRGGKFRFDRWRWPAT